MSDETKEALTRTIAPFVGRTGGLISALKAVQAANGFLPPETESAAARAFNLTQAEVKGVISFYADFHREPKGRTVVRLCAAEACQAQGGRELQRAVEKHFALQVGATSAARDVTLEPVYCLGLCSAGPSAMVDGKLIARATTEKIASCVTFSEATSR